MLKHILYSFGFGLAGNNLRKIRKKQEATPFFTLQRTIPGPFKPAAWMPNNLRGTA